jgi:hypothetical protein
LLELQDVILEMVRLTSKVHAHHRQVLAQTDRWSQDPEPEDLAEAHRLSVARIGRLKQRVLDDGLREEIEALKGGCARVTEPNFGVPDAAAAEQANREWMALIYANSAMEDHLGRILRQVL